MTGCHKCLELVAPATYHGFVNVATIREKVPEALVYELRGDCPYLLVVDVRKAPRRVADELLKGLPPGSLILYIANPEAAVKVLVGEGVHDVSLAYGSGPL